ncbi:MAG TPA: phage terminase large subunit [Stellaceae bacterium]|nr:phage terminase large subunit [Stellaceae bacterium]
MDRRRGDSGNGKSPGADCLMRDVLPEIERHMLADFPDRLREWRAVAEVAKAARERWVKEVRAAEKLGAPPPPPPISGAPLEPQAPRLRQHDVTIERVATLLAVAAPKGILIVRDELVGWIEGMPNYNRAGRAFWVEALLHVSRGHWTVMQMQEQIIALAAQWKVDLVIIEDTSSGQSLIPILREQPYLEIVGRRPDADKETRLCRHQGRFEAGRILLPIEAPWLADFEAELLAFPYGRYDDQVDALLLFLDWYAQHEQYIHPLIVCVPDLSRPDPWPDFSPRYNVF